MRTTTTEPTTTGAGETPRAETTISGVKLAFTAKGFIQPEITTRYANASEALDYAISDAFAMYDRLVTEATNRGLRLVTEQAQGGAQ